MNLLPCERTQPDERPRSIGRLRALVLLAGSVRPTRLSQSAGRSVLDLPIASDCSLLCQWHRMAGTLRQCIDGPPIEFRVMVDWDSPLPKSGCDLTGPEVRVERDRAPLRGTAGVLRDLLTEYHDDEFICVAAASQLVVTNVDAAIASLIHSDAAASLIANDVGAPVEFILLRCGALRDVSRVGFIDLKEQVLPMIARRHEVSVVSQSHRPALPIRTRTQYINALRAHHAPDETRPDLPPAFAERWQRGFQIVEEGALVDPTARLHDSVVLRGARVMPGACVVRCVVCSGAVVQRGKTIVEQIIAPGEQRGNDRWE